jgi:MFS family permease
MSAECRVPSAECRDHQAAVEHAPYAPNIGEERVTDIDAPSHSARSTQHAALGTRHPALTPWSRAGSTLRHRDFRLLMVGQALSSIGYWGLVVALGVQVLELSDSKLLYGFVTACLSLPFLFIALPAGVVADRMDRQLLLSVTRGLLALLMVVLSALTLAGLINVWLLALIAFLAGGGFALDLPARQSLAPELVEPEEVTQAIATNQLVFTGSTIVGPAIAGVIIGWGGAGTAFLLSVMGNLVMLVMVRMMRFPPRARRADRPSVAREMAEGLSFVWRSPVLQPLMVLSASLAVLGQPYQSFLPALAKDTLHLPVDSLGLLYTAGGAGSIAGSMLVASLANIRRRGRLVLVAPLCFGSLLVLLSLSRSVPVTMALLTLAGLANAIGGTMTSSILITTAPVELRGRVMSISVLVFGLAPLGNLLLGALADRSDVPTAIGLGAAGLVAVALLSAATRPRLRVL